MSVERRRWAFAAITVIVFVDALGFALVLPFLPLYASRSFGASPVVVGLLIATFPGFQLLSAPVLGWFSDHRGRRPALVVTLVGAGLGFLVLAAAQWISDALSAQTAIASTTGLALLFVARAVNGVSGGNLPIAQAYLADITDDDGRAHALGMVSTAFAVALGVGPLLAGYLAHGDSFVRPALLGAAIAAGATVFCLVALPESRDLGDEDQDDADAPRPARRDWLAAPRLLAEGLRSQPRTFALLGQWFLFILCFAMTAPMFPLIAGETLHLSTLDIGHILALLAVLAVAWQAVAMGPVSKRLTDSQLATVGLLSWSAGYLLVFQFGARASALQGWAGWAGLLVVVLLFGLGWACARPAITSALTKSAGPAGAGTMLGMAQSIDSLGTVAGPILTGALLQSVGLTGVGGAAAAFSLLALGLGLLAGQVTVSSSRAAG